MRATKAFIDKASMLNISDIKKIKVKNVQQQMEPFTFKNILLTLSDFV